MQLEIRNAFYTYPGAPEPALESVSLTLSSGWTAVAGANGAGKSTLLKLAAGLLELDSGTVSDPGMSLYCPQRTDETPDGLIKLLEVADGDSARLSGLLGLKSDWPYRWNTLSHGERKRAQIAVALWHDPDLLAVDEPANHIDTAARTLLLRGLRTYRGIGIIVSHDRNMLDTLCSSCILIEDHAACSYRGGYSSAIEQRAADREEKIRQRKRLKGDLASARKLVHRRRSEMDAKRKCLSKRGLRWGDHDAKSRIDALKVGGKVQGAARRMKTAGTRVRIAEEKLSEVSVSKERNLSFWLADSRSARDVLLEMDEGNLNLGARKLLYPALHIGPDDRIALTGENGAGKSTLVRLIIEKLSVRSVNLLHMPQELGPVSTELLTRMRDLPGDELGRVMTTVSCLGSDPAAVLDSGRPSPGELRKLMLAMAVVDAPELLVLDEPTNHLDLPSIELLEGALADFPGALLLVSHDTRLLEALTDIQWRITERVLRKSLRGSAS